MNKFVLFLYLFVNINVLCVPATPSRPLMRSAPLVTCLEIDITSILLVTLICVYLLVYMLSFTDLNCRFISFNTRLNTLSSSAKNRPRIGLNLFLLLLLYVLIFENYFILFLPSEVCKVDLDNRTIIKN